MRAPLAALLSNSRGAAPGGPPLPRYSDNRADPPGNADRSGLSPPVSIDLLITNARDEVLLGLNKPRRPPAFWLVPGGQVCKDERISGAFARIVREELDLDMPITDAGFLGVYEHLSTENFSNQRGFGTHFITLVYRVSGDVAQTHRLPRVRNRDYRWMSPAALLAAPDVHRYVKKYFRRDAAVAR